MNRVSNNTTEKSNNDKIAVFGIFSERSLIENCVAKLKDNGFRSDDISALIPSTDSSKELVTEKSTKAPEGTAAGVGAGAVVGGTLGWLAGVGTLAIPGIGPFIAAGPILAMLAGATVGAAVGGISGMLIGMGIPEYEAKRYESHLREGRYLLSIHCDNSEWRDKAKSLLKECHATDIASTSESNVPKHDKTDNDNTNLISKDTVRYGTDVVPPLV